jgi:hypothetical protein
MRTMCCLVIGLSLLMLSGVAGCGSGGAGANAKREKTVPVSGVVMFNNAPLEGATVTFSPGSGGGTKAKAAFGITDESGTYRLTTYDLNDGAIPGVYQVTVTKQVAPARTPDPANEADYVPPEDTERAAAKTKAVPLVPAKYATPATSGLTADVKDASGQTFDFKLAL